MNEVANEKAIFSDALALESHERERYLRDVCPDDSVRLRIEALLRHHIAAGDGVFLRRASHPHEDSDSHTFGGLSERIDEFRILRRIGEGGMGSVYLAEDTILGRQVALKVLAPHLIDSDEALARFRQEARAAATVTHPSIVPVFRLAVEGGVERGMGADRHYIVSEFVDGPTLARVFDNERSRRLAGTNSSGRTVDLLAWHRRVAECVGTIADALDACHRANIVHRDVKPSNILLDRERGPRLTDFGIAKRLPEPGRGFEPTSVIGSCHYMSPEQASTTGVSIDQRSDIFSLVSPSGSGRGTRGGMGARASWSPISAAYKV